MTIVSNFEIGDSVKITEGSWEHSYDILCKFGFQRNVSYEVTGVYPGGLISLKGATATYYPDYFELASATKTEEIKQSTSALDKQVSGNHYKDCGIQPIEYIHANGLSYLEGNVIKYTTRHSKKNKEQDVLKAIHYLELILEMEYNYNGKRSKD